MAVPEMSPWRDDVGRATALAVDTPAEVTVTMKAGGGYDAPWMVFRGSVASVERALEDAFGWQNWDHEKVPMSDAVLSLAKALTGKWNVVDQLAARVIVDDVPVDLGLHEGDGERPKAREVDPLENLSDNEKNIYNLVADAQDVPTLQELWRRYGTAMNNQPVLVEAWKARGRELAASAKKKGA
nr:MAG TPA: hypothetical protein [Caudoviricetes sp.]